MVEETMDYLVAGATAAAVPHRRRVDFWRDHVTGNHGALHMTFADPGNFHGETRVQRAGRVQLVDFWSDGICYERRSDDIGRDGDDSLRVVVPTAGQVVVDAAGRCSRVGPGAAAVVSMTQSFALTHDEHARAFILSVPAEAWPESSPLEGARLVATREGPGAIFAAIVAQVARQARTLDRSSFVAAAEHAFELLVRGEAGGTHRVREQARVLARRNCADPAYDPSVLSRELGLSLRTLQQRLSKEGSSPAALIRETRLELAAERLVHPGWLGRTVTAVAHASGFGSVTSFNVAFREKYGRTPSEHRLDH
jgi:AraC-like DNA-binding protein